MARALRSYVADRGYPDPGILVVAEKYQTGFDQPLLTTMYVNKTLTGVSAVQTLSRINRTAPGKSQADLAVLDFVNEAEQIQAAFQPFHEQATTLPSDPNMLYNAQSRVMSPPILVEAEMREFVKVYLTAEREAGASKAKWQQWQLYLFGRFLLTKLPPRRDGVVDIGEVELSHLRVEKTGEHDLGLSPEGPALAQGFGDGAGSAQEPEKSLLSELIDKFNERHGTDFTDQDFARPYQETTDDPKVRQAAVANDNVDNFGVVFDAVFENKMPSTSTPSPPSARTTSPPTRPSSIPQPQRPQRGLAHDPRPGRRHRRGGVRGSDQLLATTNSTARSSRQGPQRDHPTSRRPRPPAPPR
jgi:type I restriction enzyme, R subunit